MFLKFLGRKYSILSTASNIHYSVNVFLLFEAPICIKVQRVTFKICAHLNTSIKPGHAISVCSSTTIVLSNKSMNKTHLTALFLQVSFVVYNCYTVCEMLTYCGKQRNVSFSALRSKDPIVFFKYELMNPFTAGSPSYCSLYFPHST